jgi:hypothetical protein
LFWFVLVSFETFCFGCFRFYTETESFDVLIKPKQTEDQPEQSEREHILVFLENIGLFRFFTKQFCLFWLFRYMFETPKQTDFVCFWFHETKRNTTETDLALVCFGSNGFF